MLFELISARYERRTLLITANQPFGEWGKVFPDPAMTLAAVDRLVHHSTIFELNVECYRRRSAIQRKQHGPGRPAGFATPKNVGVPSPATNSNPPEYCQRQSAPASSPRRDTSSPLVCRALLIQFVAPHCGASGSRLHAARYNG